jgi:hypothetical protein
MYEIVDHFIDLAGVYFIRVKINENQTNFFTFDHYPTQEEVDTVAQRFVDATQKIEEVEDASPGQDDTTDA